MRGVSAVQYRNELLVGARPLNIAFVARE